MSKETKPPKLTLDLKYETLLFFFESLLPDVHKHTHAHMARVIRESVDDGFVSRTDTAALQPFEIQNYKRLLAMESKGIEDYRAMRSAPVLTPEAVVSFINQLSPWNLETTGLDVLKAYINKQQLAAPKDLRQ